MRLSLFLPLVLGATLAAQDRARPAVAIEFADLSRPFRAFEQTVIGKRIVERFGAELVTVKSGKAREAFLLQARIGRARCEVHVVPPGVCVGIRLLPVDPADAALGADLTAALQEADDGTGRVEVGRDGDAIVVGIRVNAGAEVRTPAAPFAADPVRASVPVRAGFDFAELFVATTAIPDFLGPRERAAEDRAAEERAAAVSRIVREALDGHVKLDIDVHAVGDRIAVDLRCADGVWLTEEGRRLLRLMPVDAGSAWGVLTYDFSPYLTFMRKLHAVIPFAGIDAKADLVAAIRDQHGVDLETLIGSFEGTYGGSLNLADVTLFDPGILYGFALKDAAPVRKAIDVLLERFAMKRGVAQREFAGYTRSQLTVGPFVLHWAFTERALFLALGDRGGRDAIEAVLEKASAVRDGQDIALPGAGEAAPGVLVGAFDFSALMELQSKLDPEADEPDTKQAIEKLQSLGIGRVSMHVVEAEGAQVLRVLL